MLSTYSDLYLYDVTANPGSELKTDYLLVNHHSDDIVLQLGLIKSTSSEKSLYHCNSFMVDYKKNKDYDLHYRNLTHRYEITKIVREDKLTKRSEVIYQSGSAKERELSGIGKSLLSAGIAPDKKLITAIFHLNQKFGKFHIIEQLSDQEFLYNQCSDKREKAVVTSFLNEWERVLKISNSKKTN